MWTWSAVVFPIFTMASVIAAVISRFCWSVRPANHWIVMFGMPASLWLIDRGRDYRSAPPAGQGGAAPQARDDFPARARPPGPRGRLWGTNPRTRSSDARSYAGVRGD